MKISGLIFARMCRFFAHFGVRTLMVLYLIDILNVGDAEAFSINTVLVTLFELGSIFGGILADRLLGFRRALLLGSALLTLGYTSLVWQDYLVVSFGLLVMGGNLLVSNIPALVGKYAKDDGKRQKKLLTIMYSLQNLGALISIPLLGVLKDHFGYNVAFAIAGVVMGLGAVALMFSRLPKEVKREKYVPSLVGFLAMPVIALLLMSNQSMTTPGLLAVGVLLAVIFAYKIFYTGIVKKEKRAIFATTLIALILFFAIEDQLASSLVVFADKVCNRDVLGLTIPSSFVAMLNPVVIIFLSPIIAKRKPRLILPFLASAIAMLVLSLASNPSLFGLSPSVIWVFGAVGVISIAELYIGPLVFTAAAESSHERTRGEVMGIVPIAFCLAFVLSGFLSRLTVSQGNILKQEGYAHGFASMSLLLFIAIIILFIMRSVMARKSRRSIEINS